MTFKEAALTAADAVANAPLNMTIQAFHERIPSLVVNIDDDDYRPMTVSSWRKITENPPRVILTLATGDSFGG